MSLPPTTSPAQGEAGVLAWPDGKGRSGKPELPEASNNVESSSFASSRTLQANSIGSGSRENLQSAKRNSKDVPSFLHKFERVLGHVNQYVLFEELGRGMQGAVYKCLNRDDSKTYAMKCLENASLKKRRKVGSSVSRLKNEIEVMKKLDHPNLVRLYEVIDDVKNDRLYLVMDLVVGGSVMGDAAVLKNKDPLSLAIPEAEAKRLFFDFCLGMEHLHQSGILHRDIKPSNMLVDQLTDDGVPRCKVCDFGVSMLCKDDKSAKVLGEDDLVYVSAQGTIAMLSPEALGGGPDIIYHGRPADVWSAGVSLFLVLFGCLPWKAEGIDQLREEILAANIVFPSRPKVSRDARRVILRMLAKEPNERATFSLVRNDPWFAAVASRRAASITTGQSDSLPGPGGERSKLSSPTLGPSRSNSGSSATEQPSSPWDVDKKLSKKPKESGNWFSSTLMVCCSKRS
jgi:serine/threonine protein kinase